MELLLAVSAQSPYSTTVPPSIQQEGVLWMIGQAPSTVYYAAPARGDSVPTDGWIVRNGVDPAPSVTSVGSKPSTFPIIGPDPNGANCVLAGCVAVQALERLCLNSVTFLVLANCPGTEEPTCELCHYIVLLLYLEHASSTRLGLGGGW